MSQSAVKVESHEGIARVTLHRPHKRNALTRQLLNEILGAVDHFSTVASTHLLILAAEGPVFCAGMDLQEMQDRASEPDAVAHWKQDTQIYRDVLTALWSFPAPTLAVVQGPALAGGLGLVLACDMVLAAEEATFGLPEPKRGICAAVVAPLLIARMGIGPATFMLLSGRDITAVEAQRWGLCHEVTSSEHLHEQADDLTRSILTGSPTALRTTKQFLVESTGQELREQLEAGCQVSAAARSTADAREGLAAFREKRPPVWEHPLS